MSWNDSFGDFTIKHWVLSGFDWRILEIHAKILDVIKYL